MIYKISKREYRIIIKSERRRAAKLKANKLKVII
jgi:hypothetical protein